MTPQDSFLEGTFWDKFWRPIRSRALLFTPEKPPFYETALLFPLDFGPPLRCFSLLHVRQKEADKSMHRQTLHPLPSTKVERDGKPGCPATSIISDAETTILRKYLCFAEGWGGGNLRGKCPKTAVLFLGNSMTS